MRIVLWCQYGASCRIERVDRTALRAADRVQVSQRGLDVTVAHELLHGPHVDPTAEQSGGEGVTEDVRVDMTEAREPAR